MTVYLIVWSECDSGYEIVSAWDSREKAEGALGYIRTHLPRHRYADQYQIEEYKVKS